MAQSARPLSPHLQIYKWHLTMALSIGHRVTGIGLALGLVLLVWWLVALASGPEAFGTVQAVMASWIGGLVLFGYTFAVLYHLANGIRHLAWDLGYGFDLGVAAGSGIAVLGFAGAATILTWLVILIAG
jgi:succinate dehydrogenase / fumarate reductase cytochrome b subunit